MLIILLSESKVYVCKYVFCNLFRFLGDSFQTKIPYFRVITNVGRFLF